MRRQADDPPVIILASGYATDQLWRAAIQQALAHGRTGWAVTREGQRLTLAEALREQPC